MAHSIAEMMLAKTGHEDKDITNAGWNRKRYEQGVHANGKVSFSIPEKDHKSIRARFFFAKKAKTLTKLWGDVGREYGKNGGTTNRKTVSDYVKNIVNNPSD